MRKVRVSQSSVMPVSLEEAKAHMRIEHSRDDTFITGLIVSAVDGIGRDLRRSIINEVWTEYFDGFKDPLELSQLPLVAINSVTYKDSDGATQTLADTVYEARGVGMNRYGEMALKINQSWPLTYGHPEAVAVTFQTGYEDAGSPAAWSGPEALKDAIKRVVAHRYENREQSLVAVPFALLPDVDELLDPFRVWY